MGSRVVSLQSTKYCEAYIYQVHLLISKICLSFRISLRNEDLNLYSIGLYLDLSLTFMCRPIINLEKKLKLH